LYNVYNPFQLSDPLHLAADAYLPQINAAFTELALSYQDVSFGDACSAFGTEQSTCVLPGEIYPTEAEEAKYADIGLQAFIL
jgi:hypothetical protein